jgi:hypothetical protein
MVAEIKNKLMIKNEITCIPGSIGTIETCMSILLFHFKTYGQRHINHLKHEEDFIHYCGTKGIPPN